MTNRLITILLVLLTTVAIVGEAGRVFMTPADRWRDWLQLLTAQQIADTLDRQVQLGPIDGLSMKGVETGDLAVAEGPLLADGAILTADRLRIAFDLPAMVRGEVAPAAGISSVRIEGAWAHIVRDEAGDLNIEKVLPEPGPPVPPEDRFQGTVTIVDSTVIYDDYALPTVRGSLVNMELVQVNAEIDMRTIGWAEITFSGRDRLARTGLIRIDGSTELETGFAWANARIGAVDAAYWFDRMVDTEDFSVQGGRLDVAASIGLMPRANGSPEPSVAGEVAIRDAAVTFAALGDRQVLADGNATVTMDGVRIHRLDARVDSTRVEASGFLGDLSDPVVDLVFDADVPRAEDLIGLLSELDPEMARQIEAVSIAGPVLVTGEIAGPLAEANLVAQVGAPGGVRYASTEAGEFLAEVIDLRLDLLDLADPNVRARADVAQAEAIDLEPLRAMLPEEIEGPLAVSPLREIGADILWSMEIPLVQTELSVPRLAVGDLAVEDLRADVAMAGDVLRVSNLTARPLGATLSADGVLDLAAEDGPWVWARGEIDGLDLARLRQLPWLEEIEDTSGTFSGQFAAELNGGKPRVVAHATLDRPHYGEYGVEILRGIVLLDESSVQLHGGSFEDELAVGWIRGTMPFEGEMAASFGIAGVNLETVARRFDLDVEGLHGEAFITGSASGTVEEPQVDAMLRAFDLGMQDYRVEALVARVEGGLEEVRIESLHASSGRIVAQADGTLSSIDFDERNAELAGTVVVSGPVDQYALDLAEMSDEDISGAVRASMEIGGTLKRPSAEGEVRLGYARYETIATDDAVLAVNLRGDVLELSDLNLPVGDAMVTGEASIVSLYDTPIVSANMMADGVMLQDLALWHETGVPMSGRVSLPFVSLQGPLDDLKGMAQVDASDLELGDESIGAISAIVVLDHNALMLQRTSLALAGGTMSLEGQFRMDERRIMPSRVELDDVSIAELLRIGVPLARRFADLPPEEREDEDEMPLSDLLASLSMRLGGRLDGVVSAEGVIPEAAADDAPSEEIVERFLEAFIGEVDVAVREPTFDNRALPPTTLHAEVAEGSEVAVDLEAAEGEGLITAAGTWRPDGDLLALAEITALDLTALREWMPSGVRSTGGQLNLTVQASGSISSPDFIGSLDIINPEAHGVRFDLISAPIIRYDGEVLDLDSLVVRESDEEIFVHGLIPFDWDTRSIPPDGRLQVTARADNTDLGIFPPLIADALAPEDGGPSPLAELRATGVLDALVSITGSPSRPELNGELMVDAASIAPPGLASPIEDTRLAVSFRGVEGRTIVELEELSGRLEALTMQASGTAEMSEYEVARLTENVYDFTLEVAAPQQRVAGGALTARRVRGNITLATNEMGQQIVRIDDLGADFGDGSILMNGTVGLRSFDFAEFAQNDFDLVLVADRARPRYSNLFLGTVDGRFVMQNPSPGETVKVEGAMTVSHAVLGVPRPSGEEAEDLRGMSATFPAPEFDVRLAIGSDVRVRTTGIVAPLEPTDAAIRARGTPQRPTIQGQIEVQQGEASMPGGALHIETAGVRFLVRPALGSQLQRPPINLDMDGRVWATATRTIESTVVDGREVGPVDIELAVSGTLPANIHVEARSSPPLAEEQIYALLGTAPFAGAGGLAEGGDLEQVMTEQFVSALGAAFRQYVFQPFEEELKQLLGLAMLEVDFAFDQPVALRLGGYLIEDLLVTYQTSVLGAYEGYDLGVSYRVERRFEVSYRTDHTDNQRMLIEYVYRF